MIAFTIDDKIYGVPITFIVGTWKERCKHLKRELGIEPEKQDNFGGQADFWRDSNGSFCTCWLPEFAYDKCEDIATLSHEIDHLVLHIMFHFDIPIVANNSNHAYIYLKEYFLCESLKKLKEYENGNKQSD